MVKTERWGLHAGDRKVKKERQSIPGRSSCPAPAVSSDSCAEWRWLILWKEKGLCHGCFPAAVVWLLDWMALYNDSITPELANTWVFIEGRVDNQRYSDLKVFA
jgi:hypothetical protein